MTAQQEKSPETAQLIQELQRDWTQMGEQDPIRWTIGNAEMDLDQYFKCGRLEIANVLSRARDCGVQSTQGRALDFGCGIGRLTQALGATYNEVHGLDISPSMIARAEELNANSHKCHFHVHGNHRLNLFDADYFDLIVAINVLSYLPPVLAKGYVREFIRILKPGGLAHFQMSRSAFPRTLFPQFLLNGYRRWKHRKNPFLFRNTRFNISEKSIRAILEEGGARVLNVESRRAPTLWIHYSVLARKE